MELILLGTGAGCGVPVFYCGCKACAEALQDARLRRTRCSAVISGEDNVLIDTPPELATQLVREGIKDIGHILLTHSHYDHVGGLGDLEYYVRLNRKSPLPAVMTGETWSQVKLRYDFMIDCMDVTLIEHGRVIESESLRITALEAAHTLGTLGFLIEHGDRSIAYIPDTGPIPPHTKQMMAGVECLVLDATFWGANWYPSEHLSFDEAVAEAQEIKAKQIYLTHLAMHYATPITTQELEDIIEKRGLRGQVHLAYDGLRLAL